MSYLAESALATPQDANGRAYVWKRGVKWFENNNIVALEAAMNTFLATLRNTFSYVAVMDIVLVPANGANTRVMVSYGWFEPDIY